MKDSCPTLPVSVVGTAGHIDHGKSALIKALTGIDPDRLPEEKKRGITIQLGYAFCDLPSGRRISIVDVPGHERFIKTMAQGASVVQVCLFVVDAGEGVKPQTVEHLHIMRSMGVMAGVIALAKCDTVPADVQDLAEGEVKDLTRGTFLEGAKVVRTSAVLGAGIEDLKAVLDEVVSRTGVELVLMPMRIPVDRVFVAPGFGTVVTGTLVGGFIREGDEVALMPGGRRAKVRGMEVHGQRTVEARAPCRIALNLAGVEAVDSMRGAWVTLPGFFKETRNMLAVVEGMPWLKKEIKLPAWLSMNLGSGAYPCRMFARGSLGAGGRAVARVALDGPVIARAGDRFIMRLPGPAAGGYSTVAGGVVVDPLLKGKKVGGLHAGLYGRPEEKSDEDFVIAAASLAGRRGISKQEIFLKTTGTPDAVEKILERLARSGVLIAARDGFWFHGGTFEEVKKEAGAALDDFHRASPELRGMKKDDLARKLRPPVAGGLFNLVTRFFEEKGAWKVSGDLVSRAGFTPGGDEVTERISRKVALLLEKAPATPPSVRELSGLVGESGEAVSRSVRLLVESGRWRLLGGEFLYPGEFLEKLKGAVLKFFERKEELRVTDLREMAGVSRKYALPLARWLDDEGVTIRRGEVRAKRG